MGTYSLYVFGNEKATLNGKISQYSYLCLIEEFDFSTISGAAG